MAQEQLAEYATEKSESAAAVLAQAQALEALLQQLAAAGSDGGMGAADLTAQLAKLKGTLADAAAEAAAFAEQQRADVERLKRSSQQVGLPATLLCVRYGMPDGNFFGHTTLTTDGCNLVQAYCMQMVAKKHH